MANKPATRSPIKDAPMRQAGEGLRAIFQERYEEAGAWAGFLLLSIGLSVGMFGGYWSRQSYPYMHLFMLLMPCIVFVRILNWRRAYQKDTRNILLGEEGERAVGEKLEHLKADGYVVLHDIPSQRSGGANIDHLAIGSGGIFVVETKTRNKPIGRTARISYDGTDLLVDGYPPDRDPIAQVLAECRELAEWMKVETGRDISRLIKPVVVFPGWYVDDPRSIKHRSIWVLNDKALITLIQKEDARLAEPDILLFANRIRERVRRYQREQGSGQQRSGR